MGGSIASLVMIHWGFILLVAELERRWPRHHAGRSGGGLPGHRLPDHLLPRRGVRLRHHPGPDDHSPRRPSLTSAGGSFAVLFMITGSVSAIPAVLVGTLADQLGIGPCCSRSPVGRRCGHRDGDQRCVMRDACSVHCHAPRTSPRITDHAGRRRRPATATSTLAAPATAVSRHQARGEPALQVRREGARQKVVAGE